MYIYVNLYIDINPMKTQYELNTYRKIRSRFLTLNVVQFKNNIIKKADDQLGIYSAVRNKT